MFGVALGAAVGMGAPEGALAQEPSDVGPEVMHAMEDAGMYNAGDEYTKECLKKIESGEWLVVADPTPPSVVMVGDESAINALLKAQDLSVDAKGIHSNQDSRQSNNWAIRILDHDGNLIVENQAVQIAAQGNSLVITMLGSDGSLDKMVYTDGSVTSTTHLILSQ